MTRAKLFSLTLVALGVSVLVTVAPNAGSRIGAAAPSSYCGSLARGSVEPFSALGMMTGIVDRSGTVREPGLDQVDQDLPGSAKGKARTGFKANVPVYFHIVTDGANGSVTDAQVADQIKVLNVTFAGKESGADSGFSFALAGVTRTDNAAWFYAGPGGTDERSMKAALHQGGKGALNIYSTTAGQYLGWTYLPDIVTKPNQAYLDGIILDWESIPGTSTTYAGRFDEGKTATHEAGHWLDLEHTFFGGCNAKGDFVDDTPPEKEPTAGCPEGKDTCSDPGLDPIHNYMDYSYDSCYSEFTPGQVQRMRDAWLFFRAA